MPETLAVVFIVALLATLAAWITWVTATNLRRQRTARVQADIQNKLLEKFGTTEELLAYLQTDAGKSFLQSATVERSNPFGRILSAIQAGAVLTCLGLAFFGIWTVVRDQDAKETMLAFGMLITALGVGSLIAGGLSYVLSKSWGLLGTPRTSQER